MFLVTLGLLLVFAVSVYLNSPPRLDSINPLPTAEGSEPRQDQDPLEENPSKKLQNVNTSLVKGHGDLAFVVDGILYMIDGSTGELKQLTESGKTIYPRWSYDGKYLAFIRITDPKNSSGSLWIIGRDGKEAYQVQGLPSPIWAGDFQWSPTEHVLAVSSWNVVDGIWLVPVNEKPQQLVKAENPIWFAWSPDGKNIAYNITEDSGDVEDRGDILYTIDIDAKKPVKRVDLSGTSTGIEIAKWWPDGKGLLYWTDFQHSASIRADGLGLLTLELDGGEPKKIDGGLAYKEWLDFSPDGKLLMVSGAGRENWINKKLVLADVKSGKVQPIKTPEGCVAVDPSFSPDGKKIAFVAAKEMDDIIFYEDQEIWFESRTLWVADADGSNAKPLINSHIYNPIWSKDGSHIYYIQEGALWQIGADGGTPKRVLEDIAKEDTWGFYGHIRYTDLLDWF